MEWLKRSSLSAHYSNSRNQCVEGGAMRGRIHDCLNGTSPVNAKLAFFVAIILPYAIRAAVDDR